MRFRPLRSVSGRELRPLLDEEAEHWASELLWDYGEVTTAVVNGLERRALIGHVAEERAHPVGYCYYMYETGRAIVGSLFVSANSRGQGIEEKLLDAVLRDAQADRENTRIECQTLFSTSRGADQRFTRAGFVGRERHYLVRDLGGEVIVPESSFELRALRKSDLEAAAKVIYGSHEGSLDAGLNRTYATPAHCQGFVETLVLRSGCGRFDAEASFVIEGADGLIGVILTSFLSDRNGHICQVSVRPRAQGMGLGRLLVSEALATFQRQGLTTASLSVTVGNDSAYGLYTQLGFRLRRAFAAHAWVRPPARVELSA